MALVPATFTVEFTSQYTGNHRICWRLSTDPPGVYDCTTVVYCVSGNTCSYVFNTQVDNETCDSVTYEGYVQPTCFDELSLDGRVAFSSQFVPDPVCKTWDITCNEGDINAIVVQNGGSGYGASFPVTIVGDGTGAVATANVSGGVVVSVTVTNGGSGYTFATVDFSAGGGTGATATVELRGCRVNLQDCSGTGAQITIPVTETLKVCGTAPQTVPAEASIVQNGHCICQDCTGYEVSNSDIVAHDVHYITCADQLTQVQSIPAGASGVVLGGPNCPVMVGSVFLTDATLSLVETPCV